jgi:D-psicose/D-tagatose/L-ribulose 3-epimerase
VIIKEAGMAKKQNWEEKADAIRRSFLELKKRKPEALKRRLSLSWSNWGFGIEPLAASAARLQRAGIRFIELHGNHYGADLGYRPSETTKVLADHGIKAAGICGMFSADNDLSSNRPQQRQAAVDYLKREVPFAAEVGASYILVVPGAVGRPGAYDATEFERSVDTLRRAADLFVQHKVKAAVEPIRAAEVSFCHTFADAIRYIEAVDHPGVRHINGDVYHMQAEEEHIGEALLAAGERLTNLHMADSNRRALGLGSLDLDTIIRALYLIGYNTEGRYVTPEPLGPGADPYPAMNGKPDEKVLESLVQQTARYFREREEAVLADG